MILVPGWGIPLVLFALTEIGEGREAEHGKEPQRIKQ